MCISLGWEYTYYLLGLVTAFFFAIFWLIYTDNPHNNQLILSKNFLEKNTRYVTKEEADYITEGKTEKTAHSEVPYSDLFSDPQVYLAWSMYISFFVGAYIFLQFGPVYISLVGSSNYFYLIHPGSQFQCAFYWLRHGSSAYDFLVFQICLWSHSRQFFWLLPKNALDNCICSY